MKKLVLGMAMAALVLAGCAAKRVHTEDLAAWKGVPVEALDTHPLFSSLPMTKETTDSGFEMRTYTNTRQSSACASSPMGGIAVLDCRKAGNACIGVFYLRGAQVVEALTRGQCYTDASTRPAPKYLQPQAKR